MRNYDVTLHSTEECQTRDIFRIQADTFLHVAETKWFYFTVEVTPGSPEEDRCVAAFPDHLVRSVLQVEPPKVMGNGFSLLDDLNA